MNFKVLHKVYGDGVVKRIYGSRIDIEFGTKTISMVFPGAFSTGLSTLDNELLALIADASARVTSQVHTSSTQNVKIDVLTILKNFSFDFMSGRVKSLDFQNNEELFEVIGYLAKPNVIQGIWAEIPASVYNEFQKVFPEETLMRITEGKTEKGMSNKFGVQCRLNLGYINNCPSILIPRLTKGFGAKIINRLNCTLFALQLVKFFGFHFGNEKPNVLEIQKIANDYGYLNEFNKGYNR